MHYYIGEWTRNRPKPTFLRNCRPACSWRMRDQLSKISDVPECGPHKAAWFDYVHKQIQQNGLLEQTFTVTHGYADLTEEEKYKHLLAFCTAPRTPVHDL